VQTWMKWIVGGLLSLLLILGLAGATFESLGRAKAAKIHPAPGQMVDIGGRRIQLDCRGTGYPTVVFESGLDTLGALSWSVVHDQIAKTTRACAYGRAGIMWSDPSNRTFSAEHVAQDLHTALAVAGEPGPYVMVGHSLGGPYLLIFTGRYPDEVAGLVFVDASHPDQRERLAAAAGKAVSAGVGMAHLGRLVSGSGLLRLIMPRGAPPAHLPLAAAQTGGAWFAQSIPAAATELDALGATLTTAGDNRALGARPLIVLTRGEKSSPGAAKQLKVSVAKIEALDAAWLSMQNDEARWSSASRHQVVPGASHYIQLDQPQVVIDAVRDVVGQVRARASGS
jgi:pimeloyl-ACP methyl ester carboxylesterase